MPIYREIYDGPPRSYGGRTAKRYIVVHNTSNDATAEAESSYAKRRTDGVSSHYYVDRNSIVQSLDTDLRANHVGSTTGNNGGISYEITGVNGWSRAQWLDRVAWPLLAHAVRRDCAEHDITPRTLTVEQIRAGAMSGIITHNQARLAWGRTTHTDPGPNFPLDYLIELVQDDEQEEDDMPLDKDDVRRIWRMDGMVDTPRLAADGTVRPAQDIDRNPHWSGNTALRLIYANVARVRAELAAGAAKAAAERVATQQLVRGLADSTSVTLSDEQVEQLAAAVTAAGDGQAAQVLARLEAAGEALTAADDDDS